jgi:hypothetical protein
MVDLAKWDTPILIRCENDECGVYSFRDELEENNWECPHYGKPIPKPE